MSSTRQLKQQVTDLILGNDDILKLIAEAVSSLIVEKISSNEEILDKIASSISKQADFIRGVGKKFDEQKDAMKQEIDESLSFDQNDLKIQHEEIKNTCNELQNKYKALEWEIDSIEQYGRRNCLLFHGIPEPTSDRAENTDAVVIDIMRNKLKLEVNSTNLDRSHRLGRRRENVVALQRAGRSKTKPRPIIVKFLSYNTRAEVFSRKRQLKGTGLGVTESLTKKRMELYKSVSSHEKVESTWTLDGRIVAFRSDIQKRIVIEKPIDLNKLLD